MDEDPRHGRVKANGLISARIIAGLGDRRR
jgi:hypothetical protein